MAGLINFNAQIAPMEHVEKVVRQEQEYSQIKLQSGMQEAQRLLSRDNEQVQETVASQNGQRVERRKGGKEGGERGSPRQAGGQARPGEEPGEDGPDLSPDVWSGNIVNLKV